MRRVIESPDLYSYLLPADWAEEAASAMQLVPDEYDSVKVEAQYNIDPVLGPVGYLGPLWTVIRRGRTFVLDARAMGWAQTFHKAWPLVTRAFEHKESCEYCWQEVSLTNIITHGEDSLPKLSRDELLAKLRSWQAEGGDQEIQHGWADDALLAYIDDPEITEAFEAIEKWYA